MRIAIGSDHGGFKIKQLIYQHLMSKKVTVIDYGCYSEESVDYPDLAHKVCDSIESKDFDLGILVCGSGNGINMTANSHNGVRSALCWKSEIASLARQHNNANVMCLPGRFIEEKEAIKCVDEFLSNEFEGGRHQNRIDKIKCK
jgi:ribose 5-phosphate isomerase B